MKHAISDYYLLAGYTAIALAVGALSATAWIKLADRSANVALKQRCYAEYFRVRGDEPRWPPAYSYRAPTNMFSSQFGTTQAAILCDFVVDNDLVRVSDGGEPVFFFDD